MRHKWIAVGLGLSFTGLVWAQQPLRPVRLAWEQPPPLFPGIVYELERAPANSTAFVRARTTTNLTVDDTPPAAGKWDYRVRATLVGHEPSAYSTVLQDVPVGYLIPPPTGLTELCTVPCAPSPPAFVNALPNGDMETRMWTTSTFASTTPSFIWDAQVRHGGTRSMKMSIVAGRHMYGQWTSDLVQPLVVGRALRIRGWWKIQSITTSAALNVYWKRADGTFFGFAQLLPTKKTGTLEWTEVVDTITVPAGAVAMRLHVRVDSIGGSAWLDDVSVERLP